MAGSDRMPSQAEKPVQKPRRARWRTWLGVLVLVLLTTGVVVYRYYTNPERLRKYAEHWLHKFSGGEAHIERVELDLLRGLTLTGVTLAVPPEAQFEPEASLQTRTLFRSTSVFLRLQPLSVLTGELMVPEVVAVNPELAFVQRAGDGVDNWQAMLRLRKGGPASAPERPRLPSIRFRNATLLQFRLVKGVRIGGRPQTIWADAQPLPDRSSAYDLRLTKLTLDERTREYHADVGRLEVDMGSLKLRGQLPSMRIDELLFASTPEMLHWIDLLAIKGSVRPTEIDIGSPLSRFSLQLSDASVAVPLDDAEHALAPDQRFIRLENVAGQIHFQGTAATVALDATFHGAPVKITGSGSADPASPAKLDMLAFDLQIDATGVMLPRDEPVRDASEARFVNRWKPVRNFVRDFDGVGRADVSARLRKQAGAQTGIEFVSGDMRPRGVSARYLGFPYRLAGLTGLVHFRPDGTETIDLRGMHNHSVVTVNGWEGGYKTQAGELTIRGHDVVLDEDLRRCLSEEDRRLCERFGLQARMELDIHMVRADRPPGTQDNPWKSVIGVELTDGAMRFADFSYPLEQLAGKVRIAEGAFDIAELSARRQDASFKVSGHARWSGVKRPQVDLRLEGHAVPLDNALAAALPAEAQKHYRRFSPEGRFELDGRVRSLTDSDEIDYDLSVRLADTRITLPTAGALTSMEGKLRVKPDRLTLDSLTARLGDSTITADGALDLRSELQDYSLHVASEKLSLDETMRGALPPNYQHFWDDFTPTGFARVDLRIEHGKSARGGDGAQSRPADREPGYVLTVDPLGATAVYEGFPLPLRDIRGSFVATPAGVEIRNMQAQSGDASIAFFGRVEPGEEHTHTKLTVQARRIRFDDTLRRALPPRVRRQWSLVRPTGEIDVDFSALDFTTGGDSGTWRFEGQAVLRGVGAELGPSLTETTGTIRGFAEIGDNIAMDAHLALERVRVDGRLVNKTSVRIERTEGDSIVYLKDLQAAFCGGEVKARAELDYGPATPTFSVWLDGQGISLEQLMNSKPKPGREPVQARGVVEARITLAGRFNDPSSRKGDGSVNIHEAQVLKIPMMLSILQVLNLTLDNNAFHDAILHFFVDGRELLLDEIDLRGKALSMVGTGTVDTVSEQLSLAFLVGGPMRLPRIALLTDLVESVARELMEVRVRGTIDQPTFKAEMVHSLRQGVDELLNLRRRISMSR